MRIVYKGKSCGYATTSQIVPINFQGFDRALCETGHLTVLGLARPIDHLPSWKCRCCASVDWYSPLNTLESPSGCFAKTYIGACGLVRRGVVTKPIPESRKADASTKALKTCDSCREVFDANPLSSAERDDDFWRCAGCEDRLFSMLDEANRSSNHDKEQYTIGPQVGKWNWVKFSESVQKEEA